MATTASTQNVQTDISAIKSQIARLTNQTNRLEREVQSKNDLTQFLQGDVIALNKSLVAEKQKSANLESRVVALETQLKNTLASFGETQGELRSTKTLVRTLQTQLNSANTKIDQLMIDQSSFNISYIENINSLNSSIMSVVQNGQKDSDVYFTTRGLDTTPNAFSGSPLQYKVVLSNAGNGYDVSSGIFTAPSTGTYCFSVTLSGSTDDHMSCYLMKNSADYLVEVYISAYSAYSSASTSTLIYLASGDTISVAMCNGDGVLSSYKSSFSGFLLK
ncbi:hypothetical protein ACF0H5_021443 [Mactra antiquata]